MSHFKGKFRITAEGTFEFYDQDTFKHFIDTHKSDVFDISIQKKRSNKQNRLYWQWIDILSAHTGIEKNGMHEVLKFKFLKSAEGDVNTGELYERILSTTELSTKDFMSYMDNIKVWAMEYLKVYLPEPGEQVNLY